MEMHQIWAAGSLLVGLNYNRAGCTRIRATLTRYKNDRYVYRH